MSVSILFYSRTVRAGFTECIDCKIINEKCDLYMYYIFISRKSLHFFLLQSKRGAQYICVSTYIVNTVHTIFVHIDVFLYFVHRYSFSYIFFYSILNLLAFSHFFFHQHSVTLTVCCIDLVLISSPD